MVGLLVGLVVGDLDVDLDLGPDWISLPVIAALVGAFGFSGAALASLGVPTALVLLGGAIVGLVTAMGAARLVRGLMDMPTDATLRASDMVGRPGRVVTAMTPARSGEVLVAHGGHQLKVAARAEETLVVGDRVVVTEVLSPTFVAVESHDRFWSPSDHRPSDPDPHSNPPPTTGGPPP